MTFHFDLTEIAIFFAILLRLSVVLFVLPIFNSRQVPHAFKACISLGLSLMLYPLLRETVSPISLEPFALVPLVMGELVFAIVLSLSVTLILSAFQMAGEFINFEMGFGFAQVVDPQNGTQTMLFSMWFQLLALMLFLSMNGHHFLLKSVVESFHTLPIGAFALDQALYRSIIALSGQLFIIAIKLSSPVLIALVVTQIGLGLMSKFAPQLNILMTSFPLTIFVGLVFMSFSVLIWGTSMEHVTKDLFLFLGALTGEKPPGG